MNRRRFTSLAALASLSRVSHSADAEQPRQAPEAFLLTANGWMPNNQQLPVLLYRGAFSGQEDAASSMEAAFTANGWPPQWRNGVYTFHHFHSTAHEVLGFAAGEARLVLGGDGGHELPVRAGDVAVLPVGTGHCELSCSSNFLVIGAYPPGQSWDICRSAPDGAALARMRQLPFPTSDPVSGRGGPLLTHWHPHSGV